MAPDAWTLLDSSNPLSLSSLSSTLRKVAILGATPNANENYEQNSKRAETRTSAITDGEQTQKHHGAADDDEDDDDGDDEDDEDDEDDCLAEVCQKREWFCRCRKDRRKRC